MLVGREKVITSVLDEREIAGRASANIEAWKYKRSLPVVTFCIGVLWGSESLNIVKFICKYQTAMFLSRLSISYRSNL